MAWVYIPGCVCVSHDQTSRIVANSPARRTGGLGGGLRPGPLVQPAGRCHVHARRPIRSATGSAAVVTARWHRVGCAMRRSRRFRPQTPRRRRNNREPSRTAPPTRLRSGLSMSLVLDRISASELASSSDVEAITAEDIERNWRKAGREAARAAPSILHRPVLPQSAGSSASCRAAVQVAVRL